MKYLRPQHYSIFMRERGVTKKEPQNIWFWYKLKQNLVFVFHLVKCSIQTSVLDYIIIV